jgi:hypothetical protein
MQVKILLKGDDGNFALILRQASYDFNVRGLKPGKVGEKQTCEVVSEVVGGL